MQVPQTSARTSSPVPPWWDSLPENLKLFLANLRQSPELHQLLDRLPVPRPRWSPSLAAGDEQQKIHRMIWDAGASHYREQILALLTGKTDNG